MNTTTALSADICSTFIFIQCELVLFVVVVGRLFALLSRLKHHLPYLFGHFIALFQLKYWDGRRYQDLALSCSMILSAAKRYGFHHVRKCAAPAVAVPINSCSIPLLSVLPLRVSIYIHRLKQFALTPCPFLIQLCLAFTDRSQHQISTFRIPYEIHYWHFSFCYHVRAFRLETFVFSLLCLSNLSSSFHININRTKKLMSANLVRLCH